VLILTSRGHIAFLSERPHKASSSIKESNQIPSFLITAQFTFPPLLIVSIVRSPLHVTATVDHDVDSTNSAARNLAGTPEFEALRGHALGFFRALSISPQSDFTIDLRCFWGQ
jgi:hypothetical protein